MAVSVRAFSLEAMFPSRSELDALKKLLPPGTAIYLSSPLGHSPARLADLAKEVKASGFEPIPHITARTYPSVESMHALLARLVGEAGTRRLLIVAGDLDPPAGPFNDALALIESDVLQRHGITDVGISGYPDGHPKIGDEILTRALTTKLEAARRRGLRVHIVTQFCFDAALILAWLRQVRGLGIDAPVQVGIAGPATLSTLMRYAMKCGVRASLKGMSNPKTMQLLGSNSPDAMIREIAESSDLAALGSVSLHFYSFGGLINTARWAIATVSSKAI